MSPSFASTIVLASLLAPGVAQACTCAVPDATVAFAQSSEVFAGTVTEIDKSFLDRLGVTNSGLWRVRFEVVQRWKGAPATSSVVRTRLSDESCGYDFERGETYLVYVVEDAEPATGLCTGTKAADKAGEDIRILDELSRGHP